VPRLLNDGEVRPFAAPFVLSKLTSLPRRLAPGESWAGLAEFLEGPPARTRRCCSCGWTGRFEAAIGLRGSRSDAGPGEFFFTAPSPLVDVLVVLDSSPSFGPRRGGCRRARSSQM